MRYKKDHKILETTKRCISYIAKKQPCQFANSMFEIKTLELWYNYKCCRLNLKNEFALIIFVD